jgi:flagellar protein FliS
MTSASPVQLVALLYQAGEDAARAALRHLERGDIAGRSQQISKAAAVILELATALDHSRGGELSKRLAGLYRYMLERLTQANLEQKAEPICEVLALLETLGSAWRELAGREIEAPLPTGHERSGEWLGAHEELASTHGSVAWSY